MVLTLLGHQNFLEGLLKQIASPTLRGSDSVGLLGPENTHFSRSPGDADGGILELHSETTALAQ